VLAKVKNSTNNCFYRTKVGIATAGEANDFPTDPVLLGGERKGGKPCLLQLFYWSSGKVETCRSNEELDILEPEWMFVVVRVFSRAKEEKEGNDDHICCGAEDWKV
jgi:hypothetical protein